MKTFLKILLASLLFLPATALATTAVPWSITNLTDGFIFPNLVNGSAKGILVSASSTFNGNLSVSTLTNGDCVQAGVGGILVSASSACGSGSGSTFGYPFPLTGNATSTLTQFNGGLTAFASSTIGNGTQQGGLTISGGATTTGTAYFAGNVGINKLPTSNALDITGSLQVSSTINTASFMISSFGYFVGGTNDGIEQTATDNLSFRTAGVQNRLVISSNGNVGVGTTTPWKLLSVGTGNVGSFAISTSTSGCAQFSALGELYSTGSACGTGSGAVSSVTGTANQIISSPTTGTVVLSLPNHVIFPTGGFESAIASITNATTTNFEFTGKMKYPASFNNTLVGVDPNGFANPIAAGPCATGFFIKSITGSGTNCDSPTATYPIQYSGGVISSALSTTTNSGMAQGFQYIGSGGIFQSAASSSLFGFTPQPAGNYITALTGDGTASGPGSAALTLATVNSNVGSFTNANITVNAKGLITAASNGTTGGVTAVTASNPLFSSGGTTPNITTLFSTTTTFGLGNNGFIITGATGIPFVAASSTLSLPNTALQNSSITVNSTNIALGASGTITAASSTLLNDFNTFTHIITGSITGNAGTATALATGRTISITGDLAYTSPSFDGSGNVTAAGTLATVNSNVGTFTYPSVTVNGKGLITAISNGTAPTTYTGSAPITVTGSVIGTSFSTSTFNAFSAENTFTNLFATNASSTNATTTNLAIVGNASNCNGTSALTTNSSGVVGCTAQPQGTLTSLAIATANGFAGSSSGGATPTLTLTTTVTGLIKGNGTAITAASNGTDYSLITALTCSAGQFFQQATAAGVFTCGTPTVTSYTGTFPIVVTGSVISSLFSTTTNSGVAQGNLYVGSGGIFQSTATGTISNGTGISVTAGQSVIGTGLTITNTGVTSNVAGTGISVSGSTGAVTITNSGVTSLTAGTGISLSGSTGNITVTNTGSTFGYPFTNPTEFGTTTAATTTPIWAQEGIFASSTSVIASTTFAVNGNVGISTSSPSAQLTIASKTSADQTPSFVIDGATGSFNADMQLNRGSNTGTEEANIDFATAGTVNYQLGIQNNSTSDFELWDGSNDPVFTVKSGTNNIGFGTSTPFGYFAINADYGDVLPSNFILNVASSSLTGTTSFFSINNIGSTTLSTNFGACNTTNALTTNSSGTITCGAITGGTGAAYPFTPSTDNGINTSATSTPIQGTHPGLGLDVSATSWYGIGGQLLAYASSTNEVTIFGLGAGGSSAITNASASLDTTAIGFDALNINTGADNIGIGVGALSANTSGTTNIAVGTNSGLGNTTGTNNIFLGIRTGDSGTGAYQGDVNVGYQSGGENAGGIPLFTTALGYEAGFNSTGYDNTLVGGTAGLNLTSGFNNIALGFQTLFPIASGNNQLNIGNIIYGTLPATTTAFSLPTSGKIGIGTTTPFAKFAIQTNNTDTAITLFAISSSTQTATSTLLAVTNTGNLLVGTTTNNYGASTFAQIISNSIQSLGGLLINTATNVTNAFSIINAAGTTVFNVDTTATNPFLGVGTTTPWATVSVVGNGTSPLLAVATTTNNGLPNFEVDANGHLITSGVAPTCTTSCTFGQGNDNAFRITTGSAVTSEVVTFAKSFGTLAPICQATEGNDTAVPVLVAASSTPTTVTLTNAALTTKDIDVICEGIQ